jgi:hypothetical protein
MSDFDSRVLLGPTLEEAIWHEAGHAAVAEHYGFRPSVHLWRHGERWAGACVCDDLEFERSPRSADFGAAGAAAEFLRGGYDDQGEFLCETAEFLMSDTDTQGRTTSDMGEACGRALGLLQGPAADALARWVAKLTREHT